MFNDILKIKVIFITISLVSVQGVGRITKADPGDHLS